jgi:hypothetical protein
VSREAAVTSDAGKQTVGVLALGLVAFILVLIGTARFGISCSPDSVAYLSAARHLACGDGLVRYDGEPFAYWPPLFPLVLGIVGFLGVDPLVAARFVNGIAFAVATTLSYLILKERIRSPFLRAVGAMTILCAFPVLRVSLHLLSEPWFIVFALGGLWRLQRFIENGRNSELVAAAMLTALACLTRYAAITLILTGCLLMFVQQGVSWRTRCAQVLIFGIIAAAPLLAWVGRNLVVIGTLTGPRSVAEQGIGEHVWNALSVISTWLLPPQLPEAIRVGCLGLVFLVVLVFYIVRWAQVSTPKSDSRGVFSLFVPVYLGFMVVSAARYEIDHLDHRMLAPVFLPIVVVLFTRIHSAVMTRDGMMTHGWIPGVVRWLLLLWAGYLSVASGVTIYYYGWKGGAYAMARWRESEVLAYLNKETVPSHLYSNRPDFIYLNTGRRARHVPTPTTQVAPVVWLREVEALLESADSVWLVWFEDAKRPWDSAGGCVRELVTLNPVHRGLDGDVFRILSPIAEEDIDERGACGGASRR